MNWFSGSSWLWKALRGSSVTFAALFALGLLGISVLHALRHLLGELGVPWLALFILPIVGISMIAHREAQWIPDEGKRKRWSRILVFGSIGISVLIGSLAPKGGGRETTREPESPPQSVRMHGPSGK